MAEYYPLLSKAVGSLPNSTPETRRVVYERARKALIGQLRTLHPPIPDADIDHESVELDRAIERIEAELANPPADAALPAPSDTPPAAKAPNAEPEPEPKVRAVPVEPAQKPPAFPTGGALGPAGNHPFPPLRTKPPGPRQMRKGPPAPGPSVPAVGAAAEPDVTADVRPSDIAAGDPKPIPAEEVPAPASGDAAKPVSGDAGIRPSSDMHRPVAPQPPAPRGPRRQMWIIPAGIVVVVLVGIAAWQLRDRPETVSRPKVTEQKAQTDSGKIAERVEDGSKKNTASPSTPNEANSPVSPAPTTTPGEQSATSQTAPNNPEVPVAHRAALLVEVKGDPNQASQVKTFLGTVVWKLKNVSEGQNEAPGLAVEADVDVPDAKLKAIITFEKNTDASLPASHTIKVRFIVDRDSFSGDIKQISVPQMRKEDNPSGDGFSGVTVPVIQNTFLVGLSPGNAETANMDMLKGLEWIDIPMMLNSGRIAKLTFEKSDSGQRDLAEAINSWQK